MGKYARKLSQRRMRLFLCGWARRDQEVEGSRYTLQKDCRQPKRSDGCSLDSGADLRTEGFKHALAAEVIVTARAEAFPKPFFRISRIGTLAIQIGLGEIQRRIDMRRD